MSYAHSAEAAGHTAKLMQTSAVACPYVSDDLTFEALGRKRKLAFEEWQRIALLQEKGTADHPA